MPVCLVYLSCQNDVIALALYLFSELSLVGLAIDVVD